MTEDTNTKRKPKTQQQWSRVRRENPRRFYSAEAQNVMLEDLKALGQEKFFKREREEGDL
ncbi:hypothetical protein [Rhodovulum steppense]|uniref:Uncharacterized protein n=1 Tax=Rhodovulum steppense TaxID=540251 RepID=A0A4R1YU38_9RHOB|nr:hypothetical protein [Rhodovulum steppense]TCM84588.1 hypothetical protein EV216_11170 [Rhodovulum steppense]